MTITEIKKTAKTKLQGSYLRCFFSSLFYFIIISLLSYFEKKIINYIDNSIVTTCISIIFAILSSLLGYGIIANILDLTDIKTNSITDFINIAIKNTTRYIKIVFSIFLRILIPLLLFLCTLSFTLFNLAISLNIYNYNFFNEYNTIILILFIITFFILLYFLLKYILASYIYHENSHLTPKEIIEKSKILMKGQKLNYILLILSFTNWFLLAGILLYIFNLFIPTTYLTPFIVILFSLIKPYITISISTFYEEIIDENNQKNENI